MVCRTDGWRRDGARVVFGKARGWVVSGMLWESADHRAIAETTHASFISASSSATSCVLASAWFTDGPCGSGLSAPYSSESADGHDPCSSTTLVAVFIELDGNICLVACGFVVSFSRGLGDTAGRARGELCCRGGTTSECDELLFILLWTRLTKLDVARTPAPQPRSADGFFEPPSNDGPASVHPAPKRRVRGMRVLSFERNNEGLWRLSGHGAEIPSSRNIGPKSSPMVTSCPGFPGQLVLYARDTLLCPTVLGHVYP